LKFEWNSAKAAENLRKHGVPFEETATVFRDPLSQTGRDPDHSGRGAVRRPRLRGNGLERLIAPAGLLRPILDWLNRAINAAILVPETKERFAQLGSEGGGGTPEEFAAPLLGRQDRLMGAS
jgi:hypothetical protein